jgi:hypothetical protein
VLGLVLRDGFRGIQPHGEHAREGVEDLAVATEGSGAGFGFGVDLRVALLQRLAIPSDNGRHVVFIRSVQRGMVSAAQPLPRSLTPARRFPLRRPIQQLVVILGLASGQ